ncbi:MAG: queuosine precursor transporter [Bifidobacteriaceae bacterium]|nr:queuosine precursor transporter [Bifidobacteriaceae bacterium]
MSQHRPKASEPASPDDGAPTPSPAAYPIVVAAFTALLLISNVAAVKLVGIGPLTFDGGALAFPVTYVLGDVLAEVWGFRAARRAIVLGFVLSALASATWGLVGVAPPAPGWDGQDAYAAVLGFVPRIVAASLAGYLVGQLTNSWLLVRIKAAMAGRALGMRLIVSTLAGEAADTAVFCTVAFAGVIVGPQFAGYLLAGYVYKCLVEVLLLPITYGAIRLARRHG